MKIYYIYHRYPHHSQHSGYAQITRFLPGHRIQVTPVWSKIFSYFPERLKKSMIKDAVTRSYKDAYMSAETKAMLYFLFHYRKIFFILEADNCYSYLGDMPNWGRNLIIGAYHQPPSYFDRIIKNKNILKDKLRKLDGIFTFSKESKHYFEDIAGQDRVFFVPHGVDVDFFCPMPDQENISQGKKICLFVGWWLRDIEMLKQVIRLMNDMDSSVYFTIVTFERFFKEFNGLKNVELLCGSPDGRLLMLYQTSSLLLLPLKDSTANNVMLEAMACGLPVVTTDVGGVRDYLNDDVAVLVKSGDADSMAEVVCHILNNKEKRRSMALAARRHMAQNFNWVHIAEKTRLILKELYDR